MSTSSGRELECARCGHFLDGHAHASDSKCKKCKKLFEICQVQTHRGWRICFVPCFCGKQYYPDKARAATPLESHEYKPDHPGYRPLSPEIDEYDTTTDEVSSPALEEGGKSKSHARTDSTESEDPLSWSPDRFHMETTRGIDELVDTMSNTHIGGSSTSSWSDWAWHQDRYQWGRYRLLSGGEYEYEWQDQEQETGKEKKKGSRSDKGKGKGRG